MQTKLQEFSLFKLTTIPEVEEPLLLVFVWGRAEDKGFYVLARLLLLVSGGSLCVCLQRHT